MKFTRYFAGLFFSLLFINGKATTTSYDYYMQHPAKLQTAYKQCAEESNSDEAKCKIINQAANDFSELLDEHNKDPEGFGTQIMNIQIALAKNQPDSDEYKKQLQQLQAMYSVIAATSME